MLHLGDGLAGLAGLAGESVDAVVTDLPAGVTAAAFDCAPDLRRLDAEMWRVLKPNGVAVMMAATMGFAAHVVQQVRFFRYDVVWHKNRPTGHLRARVQPMRAHEFLLIHYRQRPVYHPQMTQGHDPLTRSRGRGDRGGVNYGSTKEMHLSPRGGCTDRFPTSVQAFDAVPTTGATRRHAQQKPEDLLAWVVRTFTDPGMLVVDPFAGSGSTGCAALREGRRFLGWERDPVHAEAAQAALEAVLVEGE